MGKKVISVMASMEESNRETNFRRLFVQLYVIMSRIVVMCQPLEILPRY
jgi:hypothetical protein